jgi:hypothetical protein
VITFEEIDLDSSISHGGQFSLKSDVSLRYYQLIFIPEIEDISSEKKLPTCRLYSI